MENVVGNWMIIILFLGFVVALIVLFLLNIETIFGPEYELPPLFGG